jgi:dCTP deaminase
MLSDGEIHLALVTGALEISPLPDFTTQLQPASVDLRLGPHFRWWSPNTLSADDFTSRKPAFDLGDPSTWEPPDMEFRGDRFTLAPGQFVLGTTMEVVGLPHDIVGRVDGRSTFGRLGLLVHSTAGFLDPGFRGEVTLEMYNLGNRDIILPAGTRICQVGFERLNQVVQRPYGPARGSKYQGQTGATPATPPST